MASLEVLFVVLLFFGGGLDFANAAAALPGVLWATVFVKKSAARSNRRAMICLHGLFMLEKSFIIYNYIYITVMQEESVGWVFLESRCCLSRIWTSGSVIVWGSFSYLSSVSVVCFPSEQIGGTVTSLCSIKIRITAFLQNRYFQWWLLKQT